jgi:hypothetical protein
MHGLALPLPRAPGPAERSDGITDNAPPDISDWLPCHCCNRSYESVNMIRFDYHDGDAVCVKCAEWLYNKSRAIHRRLHPFWPLGARIRARLTPAR